MAELTHTSIMSDTLISPRADQNIRRRLKAYKGKTASPNFKDILRKRCIERVKARRGALLEQLRSMKSEESVKFTLTEFIERDIYDLQLNPSQVESDLGEHMMEVSEPSLLLPEFAVMDKDRWILEEYERLIDGSAEHLVAMAEEVVCPCCQRGVLRSDCQSITCTLCPLLIPASLSLNTLEQLLFQAVESHGHNCGEQPTFMVCPDNIGNNLMLLCSTCGCAHQII